MREIALHPTVNRILAIVVVDVVGRVSVGVSTQSKISQGTDHDISVLHLGLRLTPHGHLVAEEAEDAPAIDEKVMARLGEAFAQGTGYGLLRLGAGEIGQVLPPVFVWWRGFASRYVASLCLQSATP